MKQANYDRSGVIVGELGDLFGLIVGDESKAADVYRVGQLLGELSSIIKSEQPRAQTRSPNSLTYNNLSPEDPRRKLTDFAVEEIKKNFPASQFSSGNLDKSARMMGRLLKVYTEDDIAKSILYVTSDNTPGKTGFCWARQFQSPLKLDRTNGQGIKYVQVWLNLAGGIGE